MKWYKEFPIDSCPRCGGQWMHNKHYQCRSCEAFMFVQRDILLVPNLIPQTVLGWYIYNEAPERTKCVLGFSELWGAVNNKMMTQSRQPPITLPWLPMKITREELERYLLLV